MSVRIMRFRFARAFPFLGAALYFGLQGNVALAHHSFAMFDKQKTLTINGTVKDYQWTNPHVWIDVLVQEPSKSQPTLVSVEAGSTLIELRGGWSRTTLKPGDKVSLVVNPLRSGQSGGSLLSGSVNGAPIGHPIDWKTP